MVTRLFRLSIMGRKLSRRGRSRIKQSVPLELGSGRIRWRMILGRSVLEKRGSRKGRRRTLSSSHFVIILSPPGRIVRVFPNSPKLRKRRSSSQGKWSSRSQGRKRGSKTQILTKSPTFLIDLVLQLKRCILKHLWIKKSSIELLTIRSPKPWTEIICQISMPMIIPATLTPPVTMFSSKICSKF